MLLGIQSFIVKSFICFWIFVIFSLPGRAQSRANTDSIVLAYRSALHLLDQLVFDKAPESFKKAVFVTEDVYLGNSLDYEAFCTKIAQMGILMEAWMKSNSPRGYGYGDSLDFIRNFAIFTIMKDSIKVMDPNGGRVFSTIPMVYDFKDYEGAIDWTKMFVTKLLFTYSGNCHSLPYLYKILADRIGATCWLSLSPNHLYIQNRCKKIGWYNTELTSGCFPIDAWIMASGYLPLKAVQSGIYMDTLSNRESIALCILDLAKGYEHKTRNYYDGFILDCCDSSLKYYPLNAQAMLLKAETLKHIYEWQKGKKLPRTKGKFIEMESLYLKLFDLGYREMPDKMYREWLQSVNVEKGKYINQQVQGALTEGNN
jgi:hypothetical protein